jgi:NTP pyrophosphatase (non-canonical NTP hydrolase)
MARMTEEEFYGRPVPPKAEPKEPSEAYMDDALRTLSNQYHGELVSKTVFVGKINKAIIALNELDMVKKSLFYGKDNFGPFSELNVADLPDRLGNDNLNNQNIIHAIIGIATEAGELLEALRDNYNDDSAKLDVVNIREEIGDVFWYMAILARECGFSFESAQKVNIEKLRARFPDKFSSQNAIERNLNNERKILDSDL